MSFSNLKRQQKLMQMRNSKQSTKPTSAHFHKTMEINKKEQQLQLQVTQKYEKFKKSASLPSYYLNKARLRKITQIYRTLSSDKLNLHTSKSRRNSPSQTPQKRTSFYPAAFTPINLNSLDLHSKQKTKLTLGKGCENVATSQNAGQSGNSVWAQMTVKLRSICNKFEQICNIKAEDAFVAEFDRYFDTFKLKDSRDYAGKQQIVNCLRSLSDCLGRRQSIKISQVRKSYAQISDQLSALQVELKKKSIRALLDQKQVQKYQKSSKQFQNQLIELRRSLVKDVKQYGCGTLDTAYNGNHSNDQNQDENIFRNTELFTLTGEEVIYGKRVCNCDEQVEKTSYKLAECLKKLQVYSKRQKQFLSVLVVLRNEGVDIERIYDDVINGKVDISNEDESSMVETVSRLKKNEHKLYKKYKNIKIQNSFEADNSIISSADGLSFNYDDKSFEEDVYTIRRQYKCKKQLDPELKQKLKLNFDALYNDDIYIDDYESDEFEGQINAPTI